MPVFTSIATLPDLMTPSSSWATTARSDFNGHSPSGQFYSDKIEYIRLGAHFHF
jgi:hypothetical protein